MTALLKKDVPERFRANWVGKGVFGAMHVLLELMSLAREYGPRDLFAPDNIRNIVKGSFERQELEIRKDTHYTVKLEEARRHTPD